MSTLEDELVYNSINADRTTNQFGFNILWVGIHKMVAIKRSQCVTSDTTSELDQKSALICFIKLYDKFWTLTVGTWLT